MVAAGPVSNTVGWPPSSTMGCTPSRDGVVDISSSTDLDTHSLDPGQPRSEAGDERIDLPGTVSPDTKSSTDSGRSSSTPHTRSQEGSASTRADKHLAFEVPADDDEEGGESLVRRHPPLRFRKLEDNQVEMSQEMINLKQAEAEKRRSAIMSERVKSARITSERAMSSRMRVRRQPNVERNDEYGIESHMESLPEALL